MSEDTFELKTQYGMTMTVVVDEREEKIYLAVYDFAYEASTYLTVSEAEQVVKALLDRMGNHKYTQMEKLLRDIVSYEDKEYGFAKLKDKAIIEALILSAKAILSGTD